MEIIFAIIVLIVIILLFRFLGAWMFRINEIIKNQEIIIKELKKQNETN